VRQKAGEQISLCQVSNPGSNLGPKSGWSEWSVRGFPHSLQKNVRIESHIRPSPFPSAFSSIHYSLVIASSHATQSQLLKASLNEHINKTKIRRFLYDCLNSVWFFSNTRWRRFAIDSWGLALHTANCCGVGGGEAEFFSLQELPPPPPRAPCQTEASTGTSRRN
jgi:hypothetical protein